MLVDALLVTKRYETDIQPYTRIFVVDSRWVLKLEHRNYKWDPDDREYDFEQVETAQEKILLYLTSLDSEHRQLYIYQDELDLFADISNMEMEVDRYWF